MLNHFEGEYLTQKMKAILIKENKDLVWSDVGNPQPKDDQVVIDIKAAGLNRADLMQREGNYPPPPGWPQWMGLEVAGVISHAPDHVKWNIGDRVCALLGGGGYAEKVAVPSGMVVSMPDGLSFEEAAAIPEAFATSYLNLCIEGKMKSGDTVFIQAGASGLGMAAIQLAKAFGAKVVTTVGSEEKEAFVKALGADVVINRKKENIAAVLKDHPVDVAMDCVAGKNLGPCIETMARGGRWIVIATLGGMMSELNMLDVLLRGVKLMGSTLRSRTSEMKAEILLALEKKLWPAFTSGAIKIHIHKTLPVEQAENAHAILQTQQNMGKVVLSVK